MAMNGNHKNGPDYLRYYLVFFSTFKFEELTLPIMGPMEDAGVPYEPSPTLCLYVALATNMVDRIPLIIGPDSILSGW
jgi:hypothetical protein